MQTRVLTQTHYIFCIQVRIEVIHQKLHHVPIASLSCLMKSCLTSLNKQGVPAYHDSNFEDIKR